MRKDIEFKTQDGVTLAAWHYLPDQNSGKVRLRHYGWTAGR